MPNPIAKRLIPGAPRLLRLALIGFVALFFSQFLVAAARSGEPIRAVRIWPAQDYTRVTLETSAPIRHELLLVRNPDRLVLDLEDIDLPSVQQELAGKVLANDPYIANARVGQFKPGVTRLVLDLKTHVKPQIFTLAPIGEYGHRLVLDIYPIEPIDPLMALLQKPELKLDESLARPLDGAVPGEETGEDQSTDGQARPPGKRRPDPAIRRLVTIVIDPGHGGEDPGARGRRGTYEKTVTLTIARKLKTLIDGESDMRALLTRNADYFIRLDDRVGKALQVKADLFVSVHADANIKTKVRGSSVFALSESGATSTTAKILAQRENNSDLIGGVNINVKDRYVRMTLADLTLTAQISDSLKLGRAVLGELGGVNPLHKGSVEQAAFAVLKAPDIPSILVETAFISNPDEERRLTSEAYQEKIAQAILRGIKGYIAKNLPLSRSTLAVAENPLILGADQLRRSCCFVQSVPEILE
ncbi:MAG TPA: N-acetylmuramoyl-L-alanine amidase [Burkholderiales bacterium]|nr:N-acetylmuramoyl-L-alanine amidase [Burkholderiales bacterium]